MPKIKLNRNKCIGCHSCIIIAPADYKMSNDGKATLLNAQQNNHILEKEITTNDVAHHTHVAHTCPMNSIKIIKK